MTVRSRFEVRILAGEQKIINDFIETVTNNPQHALDPVPEVIETLVKLKEDASPAVIAQIDAAIEVEVQIIQDQLTGSITSPDIIETIISQIEGSPVVSEVISHVGGNEFHNVLEQAINELQQTTTHETNQLEEIIHQVQEEIFSAPLYNPAPAQDTLPVDVQDEINEIRAEVPAAQLSQTTVSTETTVTNEAIQTSVQTQTEVTAQPAPVVETAPAPSTPSVPGL